MMFTVAGQPYSKISQKFNYNICCDMLKTKAKTNTFNLLGRCNEISDC